MIRASTPVSAVSVLPWRAVAGWVLGVGPAVLLVRVSPGEGLEGTVEPTVEAWLEQALRPNLPRTDDPAATTAAHALLYWAAVLQNAGGLEVFAVGRTLRSAGADLVLAVPHASGRRTLALKVVQWLAPVLLAPAPPDRAALDAILAELRHAALKGKNSMQFLRAAQAADMPWQRIADNYFQFGWGSRSRLLQSTFTDRTPAIAANLARDKRLAAIVLGRAGLPVPPHETVSSPDQAARVAERLGYPVVVKPADLDGGTGVAAGLRDAASVRRAFERAAKHSRQILVEKHAAGRDYRLMTFHGELIWAILRLPAAVTGDGVHDVAELVRRTNLDPRRGSGQTASLRNLVLDDEALELLTEQGLSRVSVPAAGRFVRLRRIANMNMGGTAEAVNEIVHPDNRRLALQAAEALGLDIAGIDLIIDDISQSWRDIGAAICEVNAQPQLGGNLQKHVHGQILRALVPEGGRIPLLVVLGQGEACEQACVQALVAHLGRSGRRVGLAKADGAWLDGEALGRPRQLSAAATVLLSNRRTDVLVVWIEDCAAVQSGLPFDRADAFVLLSRPAGAMPLPDLLEWLAPRPTASCIVNADDEALLAAARNVGVPLSTLSLAHPDALPRLSDDVGKALFGA